MLRTRDEKRHRFHCLGTNKYWQRWREIGRYEGQKEECVSSIDRMFVFAVLSMYYYLRPSSLVVCGWLREEISRQNVFACAGRGFISQTTERPLQFTSINMPKTSRGLRSLFVLDRKYTPTAMRKRDCEFVFNLNLLSVSMGYVLWWFSRKTPSVCVNNLMEI